ncbi:MAG TPA: hypothetical protein VHJ78_04905 [Actinomycetota bacterium]|nr:hypothetical protein [Actinomycetota bacterium]
MRRVDRAATAALSLTGVVVATAIGVAVTAAARTPAPPSTETGRTIVLASPRASFEATEDPIAAPAADGQTSGSREQAAVPTSTVDSTSGPASQAPPARRAPAAAPRDTRGDGTPGVEPGDNPAGDTRGDGTPEDSDNDNDDDSDSDRRGHGGGDDGDKDNSGPGNYENPGRSNSGGDDDD